MSVAFILFSGVISFALGVSDRRNMFVLMVRGVCSLNPLNP